MTDTRPHRPDPVPHRVYGASPRNLVFPALLLPVCAGLAVLPFTAGLMSLVTPAIALTAFTAYTLTRLRGRTVLDGTGFTVNGARVPWEDITEVQMVTVGPIRSVRLLRPRSGPLVAHGLVDQPLADPRYPGRLAEVAAACAGRVEATTRRQSAWLAAAFPLVLVVTITAVQFSLVDRPWHDSPWWPGLDLATSTADPCRALSTDAAARLVPDARPRHVYGTASDPGRMCRTGRGTPTLEVKITREIMDDLVAEARESYVRAARDASADTPVPGLGLVGGSSALVVEVVARRANVVVHVQFRADADRRPDDATRADVVEVARSAIGSVTLH